MSPTKGRTALLAADLAILALAFGARLLCLGDANIWSDEGLSVWGARQSLSASAAYTAGDVHPVLYFWLLHGWLPLAGSSEFAARFLAVIAGTLTVAVTGYLGHALLPAQAWVARAGMLLLALSRFSVWWSQESRMYILGGLLATLGLALAVRLRRRFGLAMACGYVLTAAAGLWSLYLTIFGILIQSLYWLWSLRGETSARGILVQILRWVGLQTGVLLCFLPWLLFMLPRLPGWSKTVQFDPSQFLEIYATLVTVGVTANVERFRPVVAFLLVLLVAGIAALIARRDWRAAAAPGALALLILALVLPPAGVWLVTTMPRSFGKPEARYLVPFVPPLYVLGAWVGAGLAGFAGRFRRPAAVALLVGMAALSVWSLGDYYSGRYLRDEYKSVALTLAAHVRPGDTVVLHTNDTWPAFAYEWGRPFVNTPPADRHDSGGAESFLGPVWESSQVVWLVLNENALQSDPEHAFEAWLSARAVGTVQWRYGSRQVIAYARTAARAELLNSLVAGFNPPSPVGLAATAGTSLTGWEQPLRRLRAGEATYGFVYVDGSDEEAITVSLEARPTVSATVQAKRGEPAQHPVTLRVPLDTPAGETYWLASAGGWRVRLGAVRIERGMFAPPNAAPPARFPVGATFGDPAFARLAGYDIQGEARPGREIVVTLQWQAAETPLVSYKVFVHVSDAGGRVVAQRDDFPAAGARLTTTWQPGETIADSYPIPLPARLAPGAYSILAGLYDPLTGRRVSPLMDFSGQAQPSDQIRLGTLEVQP